MKDFPPILTQSVLTTLLALVSLVVFGVIITTYEQKPRENLLAQRTEYEINASQNTSVTEQKVPNSHESTKQVPKTPEEDVSVNVDDSVDVSTSQTPSQDTVAPSPKAESHTTTTVSVPVSAYATPPMSLDTVNQMTLPALVNILCATKQGSPVTGATGSGVIIDPRGVILTNAHVAQYVLLSDQQAVQSHCIVRTGSPATAKYEVSALAFPTAWLQKHGQDITTELPTGTGEHDWALLYISGTTDGSATPATFPFLQFDAREGITVTGDPVLLSSYPAGFLGSIALRRDLWPVSTTVTIKKVFTFSEKLLDLLALGGNIVAQGGSSGGAVVNPWGKLVAIIVTSSLGDTTDERDLRAVTLSHIDRSVQLEQGVSLGTFLAQGDFATRAQLFHTEQLPALLQYFPL